MKYQDPSIQQQIEAYLRQEMTDLERAGFERRMHEDTELHEEVHRQEAIIGAIRRERVMALKSGLQNVGISMWSSTLIEIAKIAAVTVGVGLASAGGYWYYLQQNAERQAVEKELQVSTSEERRNSALTEPLKNNGEKPDPQSEIAILSEDVQEDRPAPQAEILSAGAGNQEVTRLQNSNNRKSELKPSNLFQETEAVEPSVQAGQPETPRDISLPEDGLSNKTKPESLQPEVVIKRENKEKFHYQFSDGKLVLYADFSNKLYEVLELNQYGERQLYLAYDGKFFRLDSQVSEISPLKEVKDKNLIQILTDYQKRK